MSAIKFGFCDSFGRGNMECSARVVQASEQRPRQVLPFRYASFVKPVTPFVLGRVNSRSSFFTLTSPPVLCTIILAPYNLRGDRRVPK